MILQRSTRRQHTSKVRNAFTILLLSQSAWPLLVSPLLDRLSLTLKYVRSCHRCAR